jgi:hypothetical protein
MSSMQQMSFLGHLFFAPYHYANSQYSSTLSRRTRSFAPAHHALSSKRLTNTTFHKPSVQTFSSRQSILTITIVQSLLDASLPKHKKFVTVASASCCRPPALTAHLDLLDSERCFWPEPPSGLCPNTHMPISLSVSLVR